MAGFQAWDPGRWVLVTAPWVVQGESRGAHDRRCELASAGPGAPADVVGAVDGVALALLPVLVAGQCSLAGPRRTLFAQEQQTHSRQNDCSVSRGKS